MYVCIYVCMYVCMGVCMFSSAGASVIGAGTGGLLVRSRLHLGRFAGGSAAGAGEDGSHTQYQVAALVGLTLTFIGCNSMIT